MLLKFLNQLLCIKFKSYLRHASMRLCHLSGQYSGPAHSNCNLNYKDSYYIVVFHNFPVTRILLLRK